MWVEHSFGTENGVQHGPEGVEAHFMSLRDGRPLTISMRGTKVSSTVASPRGNITVLWLVGIVVW